MKRLFFLAVSLLFAISASAQKTDIPLIGAQVFVEPGQTPEEIDACFKTMADCGMGVARIRLFGAHMIKDGVEDYSLYDQAFESAGKYGVKLFATLFPPTDELNDVGGFKFPHSKKHLEQVGEYIDRMVRHFGKSEALYAWVLQNEPGTGGTSVRRNDLSDSIREQWLAENPVPERDGYLSEEFTEYKFLRYYTVWYLNWIAERVRQNDPDHYLHINPHQLLATLPEYDFRSFEPFLTSLGVSMHLSWHFGDFQRSQYPLGVSMMSDIIRERAGNNPFWITELQGGNVTASGYVPMCPTADEVKKYLWTGISAGAQGVIFWTLNARKAVMEAGEWALLDYQGEPSDRLLAAAEVEKTLRENPSMLNGSSPLHGPVTILYNDESLLVQKRNSESLKDSDNEARGSSAIMRSVIEAYQTACEFGVTPALESMEYFDWNPETHPCVVLPHIICIPERFDSRLLSYVQNGGKLLMTGLSGYYDERMRCRFMGEQPFSRMTGAVLSEVKVSGSEFDVNAGGVSLPAHLWRGLLKPSEAVVIGRCGDDVCAVRNAFGKGECWWIPSVIHLGHRMSSGSDGLRKLYAAAFGSEIEAADVRFAKPEKGLLLRAVESADGGVTLFLVNLTSSSRKTTILKDGKKIRTTVPAEGVILIK